MMDTNHGSNKAIKIEEKKKKKSNDEDKRGDN